jgi:hypothetical protein
LADEAITGSTALQCDPGRQGDQAGHQPGPGDPADHHGDDLPGHHPDGLEHAQVGPA